MLNHPNLGRDPYVAVGGTHYFSLAEDVDSYTGNGPSRCQWRTENHAHLNILGAIRFF